MQKLLLICLVIIFTCSLNVNVFSQGAAVNSSGNLADPSAMLDVSSNNSGMLIPRLTESERNAIVNPAIGLQIFNVTNMCFEFFAYGVWQTMSCAVCPVPATPASGIHSAGQTSVTWNWNSVNNATGYKYNIINDYATATDNGLNLSYTQQGLNCNTPYSLFVWAYNSCGSSVSAAQLSAATPACLWACGSSFTLTHNAGAVAPETKTITYNTVSTNLSGSNLCWIVQNLGAENQATASLDGTAANAGWRWQFNRAQGYKPGPSPAWTITSISENSNWNPSIDPCELLLGTGWRLPTQTEWVNTSSSWANAGDSYNSVLKVHAAGFLESSNGSQNCMSWCGLYWSSTQYDNTNGHAYYNGNSWSQNTPRNKAYGYTIRCVQ